MKTQGTTRKAWVVAPLVLALATSSCIFNRGPASGIDPPPNADPGLTARVGLVIATNSESFQRLTDAPDDGGVVVLFVQPQGPADGQGVERGDVITEVDGEPSPNAELAVVQLRSRPDQSRRLTVVKRNGDERTVSIEAKVPGNVNLRSLYAPLIEANQEDPILRFLRAQAGGPFEESVADTRRALELNNQFVEARSLQAELLWNQSRQNQQLSQEDRRRLAQQALTDWTAALRLDSDNTRVLVSRAQALAQIGNAATAKRDAETARGEDELFPGAHYAFGLAEAVARNYEEAAGPARRAIELNPYDIRYYELLGLIYKRLEREDDCTKTMEAIADLLDQSNRERVLRICD